MDKLEYNKIYDKFINLINHKINEFELTKKNILQLEPDQRKNLKNLCLEYDIVQIFNQVRSTYIFKIEVE